MVFNISLFSEDVKVRRFDERKSLRVAAKDAKVSFSTLSRIENGKIPDLETFGIVCEWLGENHSKYFNFSNEPIIKNVKLDTRYFDVHGKEYILKEVSNGK